MTSDSLHNHDNTAAQIDPLTGLFESTHPVDLRLSLPLPGRPVFFSLIAGRERRSPRRLAVERHQHPLRTFGNIVFMLSNLTGFYALALFGVLLIGSILEF
jgi:hypothetical protein